MDFGAIEKALLTMGKAIIGVMERLDELISVNKEILEELKKK
jgi:hypothetical protein